LNFPIAQENQPGSHFSGSGMDSHSFAFKLLEETKVAVAPGMAFGEVARDFVRISLASSEDDLREGIERMGDFIETVSGKA